MTFSAYHPGNIGLDVAGQPVARGCIEAVEVALANAEPLPEHEREVRT
jgi:hypothetical protein